VTEGRAVLVFGAQRRHIGPDKEEKAMFWAVAIGLAGVTAALIVVALLGRGRTPSLPATASDVQFYRDQLDEVGRDVARGTLSADEAARVRIEVSRRLLDANRAARGARPPENSPPALTGAVAVICALVVLGGGIGTYLWMGAPGYPDLPMKTRIALAETARADRPGQIEAQQQAAELRGAPDMSRIDPKFLEMIDQLRQALVDRPDDLRGHELLARNEAALGNHAAAIASQQRVIALKTDSATAADYTDLAEYMILAAGGYVSPEAEAELTRALRLDNGNGAARYYSGLLYAQTGRPDLAFQLWSGLLEAGPESAPWIAPIRAQIAELADLAGVRYDIPSAVGPDAEAVAAAEQMTPEQRTEMIRGMVSGLAARLADQGGPPADWARLIAAYGVLGEERAASDIYREALTVFADDPDGLRAIRGAGQQAGVAQ